MTQRFGISDSVVSQIAATGEQPLVAGKLKSDTEYVILVVPLWFNVVTQFIVATEQQLLLATKTLWHGVTEVLPIFYDDIYSVIVTVKKKKLMYVTQSDMNSKLVIRLKSGDMIELTTTNHALVKAIGDTVAKYVDVSTQP